MTIKLFMRNNILMTLVSSLVATPVFGIIDYLISGSIDYVQIIVFFVTYSILFYMALKIFGRKKKKEK